MGSRGSYLRFPRVSPGGWQETLKLGIWPFHGPHGVDGGAQASLPLEGGGEKPAASGVGQMPNAT